MTDHILFHTLFLLQILLVSFYLPGRVSSRLRFIFATYPPSQYPKLYPKPIEHYGRAQRIYRVLNGVILFAGFLILAALLSNSHDGGIDNAIVIGYIIAQLIPSAILDTWSLREFALMRSVDSRTVRKAQLRPRRVFDIISPTPVIFAAVIYVAFVLLVIYAKQFGYPSIGGYWNIVNVTALNVSYAGLVLWFIYGKKMNPHQSDEDRVRQIKTLANLLILVSIATTLFTALSFALSAFNVRHLLPAAISVYFQIVVVFSFQSYLLDIKNFDVYKKNPVATS